MKKFNCPFCAERFYRNDLSKHIEKEHDDEVPVNYTPYRMAYDVINDKDGHGNCTICGKPTTWNERTQKYNRLCGRKECTIKSREFYKKNMIKVYNKISLLDDPKHQEKMLAGRRISGKYKWSDGTIFTYTGKYENKLMEFLDQVMNFKSNEVIAPGPTLEYDFKGKKHHWITDFLLLPYNLIIEVKDGGDNPNNRFMPEYRSKQVAKEEMITNLGTYSYIRLTNNDFGQLMCILAEMKMNINENKSIPIYRIHESSEELDNEMMILKEEYSIPSSIEKIFRQKVNKQLEDTRYRELINHKKVNYVEKSTKPDDIEVSVMYEIYPKSKRIDKEANHKFIQCINNLWIDIFGPDSSQALKPYTPKAFYSDPDTYIKGWKLGLAKI